ncbi:hypothetical protein DNU42_22840 [Salmonella enterica subsp. enterica serovar Newport]|nr:hypothetical protein [Salmonella enterica subsp. enterica serovar Newport]
MDIMEGKTNREKTLYFIFLLLVLILTTGLLKAYSQKIQPTIEEIKNNMELLALKVQVCDKEIEMRKIRPDSKEQEECLEYKKEYKQIRQQYEIITANNKGE